MSDFDDIDSMPPGPFSQLHEGASGMIGSSAAFVTEAKPMDIAITADGVRVGGHLLTGCTEWQIVRHYGAGLTEIKVTLVTGRLDVALSVPENSPANRIL